jgi:Protein of unknown function (DUF2867)
MAIVTATEVPEESALRGMLAEADFFDAYRSPLSDPALTPVEIFIRSAKTGPAWAERLMSLRNFIVRQLGLKDVGAMTIADGKPASSYRVGDRLGIFSIFASTENELLLGIDDKHLDVRVSVLKRLAGRQDYVVSSAVKVHNWLGHLYMMPVGRIHPLVVKALMRRAEV